MRVEIEGYSFDFPAAESIVKFDGPEHRMSSAMKAVDVVIEMPDQRFYIEVKNFDAHSAEMKREGRDVSDKEWQKDLRAELVYKFRDSLLYHWCQEKPDKKNIFLFLTDWTDSALLNALMQDLDQRFPRKRHSKIWSTVWQRTFVETLLVLNDHLWNKSTLLSAMGTISKIK